MSGTDLRVRAHITYSVTSYHETGKTGTSREAGSGFSLDSANAIAEALYGVSSQPRALYQIAVNEQVHDTAQPSGAQPDWLASAAAWLALRPAGTLMTVERVDAGDRMGTRLTTYEPVKTRSAPEVFTIKTSGFDLKGGLGDLQSVADTVKDSIMREISRINLPERWEDLSSETTRRGLEAFMAVQTVGKDAWRDHEIEGMVNRIAQRTGKAKIDLRRMFENAQERVMEAKRILADAVPTTAPLTAREEHYCKNRAKGCSPVVAARYAGYLSDWRSTFNVGGLENSPPIQARIAELITAKAPAEATPQALPAGAARLDNATQEFFALNIGFYGMTVEAAAKQMSLPLETADGLMEMPTVKARIKFFQRTLRANVEAFRAEGPQ
ncbi:hypothetical protein MARCHEWKA_02070 [Brevundimonas phage vB_BpoS-Marchewka]|uniref:Uncharacterized protein n=1 Tax=Brevundimonas phage vB_BpoS-Marchewka TaxID=2948604 RepID=A0A9E7N4F8_9CAUD|nr:hypothetical protein MARCHEWKA_02070 [Brevundimonas phage vB_BpoS-Marchewka]